MTSRRTSPRALSQPPESRQTKWLVRVSQADERTMTIEEVVDSWITGLVSGWVKCRQAGGDWALLREVPEVRERMARPRAVSRAPTSVSPGPSSRAGSTSPPPLPSPRVESGSSIEPVALVESGRSVEKAPASIREPQRSAIPRDLADEIRRYVSEPLGAADAKLSESTHDRSLAPAPAIARVTLPLALPSTNLPLIIEPTVTAPAKDLTSLQSERWGASPSSLPVSSAGSRGTWDTFPPGSSLRPAAYSQAAVPPPNRVRWKGLAVGGVLGATMVVGVLWWISRGNATHTAVADTSGVSSVSSVSNLARAPSGTKPPAPPRSVTTALRRQASSPSAPAPIQSTLRTTTRKPLSPPAERAPTTSELPPFNPSRAMAALNRASSEAPSCARRSGPSGMGSIQVTFEPETGSVSSAVLMGQFANTDVGACVVERFMVAQVEPFGGAPVSATVRFGVPQKRVIKGAR